MALPPTIPTSFVPYSASASTRQFRGDFSGAFNFFAYAAFFIALSLAVGVFFYGRILSATLASKDADLSKAEASVDETTVNSFLQLHNRLLSGETLLGNHVALSNFFTLLETIMPTSVRFSSLNLSLDSSSGAVQVDGSGVAKSFNALASASIAFAKDGRIKNAIFSNISVNKNSSVTFAFTASLDPKLVAFSPSASATLAPNASTTTASTTATTSAPLP